MPQPPKSLDPARSPQHWFGAHLRHWRILRGLTQRAVGMSVHVSGNLIGKIEKGERACTIELARDLDRVLETGGILAYLLTSQGGEADNRARDAYRSTPHHGAGSAATDAMVMLSAVDPEQPWSPVDRRSFLAAGTAGAACLPPLASLASQDTPPPPEAIRPGDITEVQQAALALTGWHHHYGGGGLVQQTATAQLNWAVRLLDQPCPEKLRTEMFAAAAHLGMVAGAAAFDTFAHDGSRKAFAFAAACAEEAGDWHLRAKIYSWRTRHAVWLGNPTAALTHAEVGLVQARRLTASEQAMLHTARARAHASAGDTRATLDAVRDADEAFNCARPAEDPPWMAYYDHAQHNGDTGHALFEIAMKYQQRQHVQLAVERLSTAAAEHSDAYIRSRAFSRAKLATLTMATGDPAEAASIGHTAMAETSRVRSRRAEAGLRELADAATTHRKHPDASELRQQIRNSLQGAVR